jgi:hypothetical protein
VKCRTRLSILFVSSIILSVLWGLVMPGDGMGVDQLSASAGDVWPWPSELSTRGPDVLLAQDADAPEEGEESSATAASDAGDELAQNGLKPFDEVVSDLSVSAGLFKIYQDPDTRDAYLGLSPNQLNQNLLLIATLESGIGEGGLFRGWPINDLLVQFREAPQNKLQVVVPNIYLRNPQLGAQNRQLLQQSFSDSILFALPIVSIHPDTGEMLVDLDDLLLSRDPANLRGALSWALGGYSQNSDLSYLGDLKAFPENLELETVLGFSGGGATDPLSQLLFGGFSSLPDPRGFSLRVRYSLSLLPNNPAFEPRPADERVGYFITAFRSPAQSRTSDGFVRYINRWHLEKRDPNATLSPPKEPIVFWIENAVPQEYRQAIWEGIELWNQAFEQAGFEGAIEVRLMPDNADWDPADVRYNVIRWSDSFVSWVLGLGPSRVNPLTGEILDADVILDAGVIRYLNQQYDTFVTPTGADTATAALMQLCGHPLEDQYLRWMAGAQPPQAQGLLPWQQPFQPDQVDYCAGMMAAQQTAFGALAIGTLGDPFSIRQTQEDYVNQYLRALTAHEVGHVLGLRHNFLGSTLLSPEELNNPDLTESQGMLSSVMDYFPPNLAAPGQPQGDFFPTKLGPYDTWAIEYGYTPTSSPLNARRELEQIARRSSRPELAYAADEDIFDFLDPKANAWDLSNDPLKYAQWQMANAKAIWNKLDWYSVDPGEGYGDLRQQVDLVFNYYLRQAFTLTNYIGGQRFNRVDPWSSRGQAPFEAIPAAEQHQALATLNEEVFAADALQISPELVRLLAPDRWRHWGQTLTIFPLDYPIYNRILLVQALALSDVLNGRRLERLRDGELNAVDEVPLTLAELFDSLNQSIWSEVMEPEVLSNQGISSVRRGLQRYHLTILANLVLRNANQSSTASNLLDFISVEITRNAPEDARVLARYQLRQLQDQLMRVLQSRGRQLDTTSLAHLEDVRDRIHQVLGARMEAF